MGTRKLNAVALKDALWETLQSLKDGEVQPAVADSIASQAREILRTGKLQLAVAKQSGKDVPKDLQSFAGVVDA